MRGYQAIADALVKEGVEHIFAVGGDDNVAMLSELKHHTPIRVIKARKECGAAGMADGYSRVTGKPGVCTVTVGPGLTNTATALVTARMHKSPVICITTETSIFNLTNTKGIGVEQRRFAEITAGRYIGVRHLETLAQDIALAFRHVQLGGGPVVVAVPHEIMKAQLEMDWDYTPAARKAAAAQRAQPDPEMVAKAAAILREAKRPVILAGRGAFDSHAEQEVEILAERTGALLATTLLGKGFLAEHPFNVGLSGACASDAGRSLLAECDCLVAVGAGLNLFTTAFGLLYSEAKIIHVEKNPARIGEITPVSLGVIGDAQASLAALNRELAGQRFVTAGGFWNRDVAGQIAASRELPEPSYVDSTDVIDPRLVLAEMDRILPKDRTVVVDAGHFMHFMPTALSVADPSRLVWPLDFGTVGLSLFQGIGAAVGRPDGPVVVFVGDGGFMMSLEELDTAVREGIPLTVVVMNDQGFGAEVHFLEADGKPGDVAEYDNPDFGEVARSLGAVGLVVRTREDLHRAIEVIGRERTPVVVDARVNRNVVQEVFQEMIPVYLE